METAFLSFFFFKIHQEIRYDDDDSLRGANSLMTASILSELAKTTNADIVIFGTESTDGYTGTVPQQVARFLKLDCISYIKGIEISSWDFTT